MCRDEFNEYIAKSDIGDVVVPLFDGGDSSVFL